MPRLRRGDHPACEAVRAQVEAEPRAHLEYVSVVDAETLEKLDRVSEDRPVLIALAARVGSTRLIDNLVLQPSKQKKGGSEA